MLLDGNLLFDTQSAITSSRASTNVLDMGANRDIGVGDTPALKLLVIPTTGFATTNAATLRVQYQASTDSVTWTTYAQSDDLPAASLVAGKKIAAMDVPRVDLNRYHRLNYVVGTGVFSAGAVTAAIVLSRDDVPQYPANYNAVN
ncbi:hypothetical protein NUJ30_08730 [Burkholderia contaminans]|uniref:Bbp16 family capsid cement protein n=1 Tax=Burkholderia contaminans TaxID=488447 RepID=UPI00174C9F51|nr:hypothetical protein [Burkholderia contaminans]MBD1412800.1 hypothetical protein [Burkholderia contaminans]UXZ68749.1 hypothetical protein NUJ29_08735 [Burkholderia contaminans]UXZ76510.1 hypothetical protein NUJ30_08730 [Burkholderia contaminans]